MTNDLALRINYNSFHEHLEQIGSLLLVHPPA